MSTILITGGAGFIGSRLGALLSSSDHRVVVADVLHPQVHPTRRLPDEYAAACEFVPFDVTHADPWEPLLRRVEPDVVVHLAAETGTGQSLAEATRHGMVNVVGTTQLLDALYRLDRRPEHLVLASSRAVYGDGMWLTENGAQRYPRGRQIADLRAQIWDPTDADGSALRAVASTAGITEPRPTNVYAATKLAQEHIMTAWCSATETRLSILRLQNVYGPGQSVTNSYTGVLTFFAREANAGRAIDVYEDGEIIRDFVFVDDVVAALASAVERPPLESRLLDIGSGSATTIAEAAAIVALRAGAPTPVVSGRFRAGDVRAASCSIDAAIADIGYRPSVALDDGIGRLLDWMAMVDS